MNGLYRAAAPVLTGTLVTLVITALMMRLVSQEPPELGDKLAALPVDFIAGAVKRGSGPETRKRELPKEPDMRQPTLAIARAPSRPRFSSAPASFAGQARAFRSRPASAPGSARVRGSAPQRISAAAMPAILWCGWRRSILCARA